MGEKPNQKHHRNISNFGEKLSTHVRTHGKAKLKALLGYGRYAFKQKQSKPYENKQGH